MSRPARPAFPATARRAQALGERLRLARLRRRLTEGDLAARVGVSRPTIRRLEAGSLAVSYGVLARVLEVLSLGEQLDLLAREEGLGGQINDSRLTRPRRPSASTKPS